LVSLPGAGSLTFTIEWDATNTSHAALWTNFTDASPTDAVKALWTVTFNDKIATAGTTVTFNGAVTEFPWDEIDIKQVAKIDLTVSITGAITITPAT
jgi:hypothetical protein